MTTTENKIEVTYQEAWINRLFLSVEFKFNDVELEASCRYYVNHGIEDISVSSVNNCNIDFVEGDEEYKVGKRLLEEMDLNRHLTF